VKKEKAMASKKKSSPSGRTRPRAKADPAQAAGNRIRETWDATVDALTSAEAEAERQLRRILARNKIKPADARAALAAFRARVEKQRHKAGRELETTLSALQQRLRRDGKRLGRAVGEAVRGTLVALNIPSRREISDLTSKVDELSRKIDAVRRPPARPRGRRRPAAPSAPATPATR
jgi:poly(hydroxyalkanoate) granule associated protein phasin